MHIKITDFTDFTDGEKDMPPAVVVTQKQVEAIAYELAERFFKRAGNANTLEDMDALAEAIAAAIVVWVNEKNGVKRE